MWTPLQVYVWNTRFKLDGLIRWENVMAGLTCIVSSGRCLLYSLELLVCHGTLTGVFGRSRSLPRTYSSADCLSTPHCKSTSLSQRHYLTGQRGPGTVEDNDPLGGETSISCQFEEWRFTNGCCCPVYTLTWQRKTKGCKLNHANVLRTRWIKMGSFSQRPARMSILQDITMDQFVFVSRGSDF